MHACMQSKLHIWLSCLQVCTAAASLCAPLIEISIARGLPMACTCVSHYSKLQILPSKSKMFHSHFVISSVRKKLSAICDSRKIPVRILKAIITDLWNHSPGDAHLAAQRHGSSFLQMEPDAFLCLEWISMRYLPIMNSRMSECIGVFFYCFVLYTAFVDSKQIHFSSSFLCSDVVIRLKRGYPKTIQFHAHIVASEVPLLWRNKRRHTHSLQHVRCSIVEPSGSEDHWIQKPTTKRRRGPTLLLEPSQLSSVRISKVGENDGWKRRWRREQNHSDLSIHPLILHVFLLSSPTPHIPRVQPPSHRCIDLFSASGRSFRLLDFAPAAL